MNRPFDDVSTEKLGTLLQACQNVLSAVSDLEPGSREAEAVHSLLASESPCADFRAMMQNQPEVACTILRASMAALANAQSACAIQAELKSRATPNN